MRELLHRAFSDIRASLHMRRVWWALASEDVVDSHRRTVLGPIWPLLNYLLFCGVIILILGNRDYPYNYTTFVASGLFVWLFINEVLTTSAGLFLREESFIKGTVLPLSIYVFRQTSMNMIRSFYALVGTVPVVVLAGFVPSAALLTVPVAIALVLVTAPAITIIFGLLGVMFRDFQHIVSNAMRLLFFVTPVFWKHEDTGGLLGFIYHWNPMTHYIDIVRRPIVEGVVPTVSWAVAGLATACLCAVALIMLGRYNRRIVFML